MMYSKETARSWSQRFGFWLVCFGGLPGPQPSVAYFLHQVFRAVRILVLLYSNYYGKAYFTQARHLHAEWHFWPPGAHVWTKSLILSEVVGVVLAAVSVWANPRLMDHILRAVEGVQDGRHVPLVHQGISTVAQSPWCSKPLGSR